MTATDINSLPEPPGGGGLPFIGETIAFFTDPDFNSKRVAKYGKVYQTSIFGSPTIASFCLLTAQHPDVMSKLRAEQDNLNITGTPTLENLKSMTYLDMVLKEVMRLVPPVGGGFRKAIKTFEFNGYRIPKGWNIQYQIAQTHQDKELYPQSDRFDPERFNPENPVEKQASFGYIPFGGGLRECIGWQRVCPFRNAAVCG